jgi:hypothetical protein
MIFSKEALFEVLDGSDEYKEISNKIIDHSRWSVIHELIFQVVSTGKYYRTDYSVGATESQDETPWQYDGDEIECDEVVPVEKTVITYVKV